jgi:hypothetical protein
MTIHCHVFDSHGHCEISGEYNQGCVTDGRTPEQCTNRSRCRLSLIAYKTSTGGKAENRARATHQNRKVGKANNQS